jgi:hypothetical protein
MNMTPLVLSEAEAATLAHLVAVFLPVGLFVLVGVSLGVVIWGMGRR